MSSKTSSLVDLTPSALKKAVELLAEEQSQKSEITGLRLGVKGGGCSGFSYKLQFDGQQEKDHVINFEGINVYIDPKSAIYLKGITLDYHGGLDGKGFVFLNPNAKNVCGCGESFDV